MYIYIYFYSTRSQDDTNERLLLNLAGHLYHARNILYVSTSVVQVSRKMQLVRDVIVEW